MNGQWMGTYAGSNTGVIIVNVDDRGSYYQGVAYLHEHDSKIPSTAAGFRTVDKSKAFKTRTTGIVPIDPRTREIGRWDQVKDLYGEGASISTYADVTGSWDDSKLTLDWLTDAGVKGSCVLARSEAGKASTLVPLEKDWGEYKKYVAGLEGERHLFRGQNKPWRLRTAYHRSGRADLVRFLLEDIQVLYKRLSARTEHLFDLLTPDENGAFLSLAQHHGYPTPLLCWTYSPYVAAWFAYRGISHADAAQAKPEEKVRILVFDQEKWREMAQPLQLVSPFPYLSIAEFLAVGNERLIPQQAASTVTNLDDIEVYVHSYERDEKKYLLAIDLPKKDRPHVIRELGYMGITAGSLFPGLDGDCEELRERNFP